MLRGIEGGRSHHRLHPHALEQRALGLREIEGPTAHQQGVELAKQRAEVERRIAAQIAPERARELADYTLENDGSLEELRAKATELFHKLKDV